MKREEILQKAMKAVSYDREAEYGSPKSNFEIISNLWSDYLMVDITPQDVPVMMALLKLARTSRGEYHADNYIDIAGYAALAAEVAEND